MEPPSTLDLSKRLRGMKGRDGAPHDGDARCEVSSLGQLGPTGTREGRRSAKGSSGMRALEAEDATEGTEANGARAGGKDGGGRPRGLGSSPSSLCSISKPYPK
ncbi:hypothetical protein ZWY2020_046532 [Hordeum vulgare]|nr:hypothetical protein ZWY2020_046532 [Hordeum vulgare]